MKTLFKLLLIILVLGVTVLFNIGLIDIRLEEIRYFLGKIASHENISNTFGIVAKYELIKKRMQYGDIDEENYALEAKIQALTSENLLEGRKQNWTQKAYRVPVRFVVNVIRRSLGKEIINPKEDDRIFGVLEIAYFWERNRRYENALKMYDEILNGGNLAPDMKAAIMVHQAFCYSMMSEYDKAIQRYELVINMYPNTEAGILSWKLLEFLQGMEKRRNVVAQKQISEFEKGKQYFLLMDYRNAVKYFSRFLSGKITNKQESEARYFKGRAAEEIGQIDDAMMEYRHVMQIGKNTEWAKQANRRMYMLGEFYEQQEQMALQAKRQLETYKDELFMDKVKQYAHLVKNNSLYDELKEKKGDSGQQIDDSLMDLINKIGNLDLTGDEQKKQQELERVRRQLIAQEKLSRRELMELNRRKELMENPSRRPSTIKKLINEKTLELRYLYNKRLRKGEAISGRMLVSFEIQPDGSLENIQLMQSNIGDETFEREILSKIAKWRFGQVSDTLGALSVNYPFDFYKE